MATNDYLKNKVALVTGASSGIGRAVAKELAISGAKVAVCARRPEKLASLQEEVGKKENLLICPTDLQQESQIISLFQKIKGSWGGVDILINNAGLSHKAPLMYGKTEDWRQMLEVNVLALCICTREAIKHMQQKGQAGNIIHISSMAGHRIPNRGGVYAATKFAVRALTEGLRRELRETNSEIRITAISPALVETDFMLHYFKDEKQAKEIYSRFKVLQPEDVVNAVKYILSQPPYVQVDDILLRSLYQST